LVDINPGSGSGFKAVAAIRQAKPIPYMYMTGAMIPVGQPDDIVLYKPFVEADLVNAIDRISAAPVAG
jgi:CheY-like chemotaxis protein